MFFGDQVQGGVGGKTGIGDHHDLLHPGWRDKVLEPLPQEDILMPFDGRVNRGEGHWDTQPAPTRHEQDHLKPQRVRSMRTVARRMAQGMLPAALGFQCTLPDERENAVGRRRQRAERGCRHLAYHRLRIPLSRPDHAQGGPVCERRGQVRGEPLERAFAWVADQGHQQPTADQKVLRLGTAKVPLERVEHLGYLAWDACATPHGSRSCVSWDVGYIQNTQER